MVSMGAKSAAIPFLPQPAGCDGTLVGDVGFDPLGLSSIDPKSLPQIIPEAAVQSAAEPLPTMYWMREAELKHGRLCMLAIVGCITVDSGIHFPGAKYEGLSSIAAHDAMVSRRCGGRVAWRPWWSGWRSRTTLLAPPGL